MGKVLGILIVASLLWLDASAQTDNGFYFSGSVGNATLDDDFDGIGVDSDSLALRLVAGWRFNRFFGLEGGYQDFGDFEQTLIIDSVSSEVSLSADGFVFGLAGTLPLGERFAARGRAGMFFWNGTAEINGVSQASPNDTNPYLGIGLSYSVSPAFAVVGDWSRYDLEDTQSNVFSIGFEYKMNKR